MTENMQMKPRLIPVETPWSVAGSASFLQLHLSSNDKPEWISFVGYFRLDHRETEAEGYLVVAEQPPEFVRTELVEGVPYRLVRVNFINGHNYRILPAISDREVFPENDYDWSAVPGDLQPGEDTVSYMARTTECLLRNGNSPNPSMYEIDGSTWLEELGIKDCQYHHYLIAGDDKYVEVIAESWSWEAGQAVR